MAGINALLLPECRIQEEHVTHVVSKVRAKKIKTREKRAEKAVSRKASLNENPVIGIAIVALLWVLSMLLLGVEGISRPASEIERIHPPAVNGILSLIGLVAAGLFLKIVRPASLRNNSTIEILALVALIALISAKAIVYVSSATFGISPSISMFLLPLALAPLLTSILLDNTAGIAVGVWTSLIMTLLAGVNFPQATENSFHLFLTGILATLVAAYSAKNVRTRAKAFRTGIVIGLAEATCALAMPILPNEGAHIMLTAHRAAACLGSAFLSVALVLFILPILETLFRITTDITLLEISDLGHPLLQKLALEAPGTYHHSLVVAGLAHAAADQIGANALLARVSAYFHDIGKLTKPDFFSENIPVRQNPHDALQPSMSTLVITSHVKEGLSLAMLHKLPAPVMDVIREHHGTSLISYFHHKARTQLEFELNKQNGAGANGRTTINESDYRYAGPKPRSRESAIICLADAVEAASRSLEKTTPGNIQNLVDEIVETRFEDGQLDLCQLTLAELIKIKQSFVFSLTNMFHGRVAYPKNEDRDNQQAKDETRENRANKEADAAFDGTGRAA